MKIAVKGSLLKINELKQRISSECEYKEFKNNEINLEIYDTIIDLDFDTDSSMYALYSTLKNKTILLSSAFISLLNFKFDSTSKILGCNFLPTFINKPILECCNPFNSVINNNINCIGWNNIKIVDTRVGLVTPRVICMIINEAYYTFQEGTASKEDIDKGMKLGTNYPYGPFEWCILIGISNVYLLLESMWNDTHDERYKISSFLKKEYLYNLSLLY